ncbi:hypothetical protein DUNSADRAFT_11592 [Dunaliella salina]|uniref:ubiquitinyl hydrolase 1 n=1 Tax=Dunaliella salina TaxID=3046 RepID=A0ABQ7GD05_DUNSA|nr:hypothetical protein DUNSADRAFT_11592 [Dunaliella salina]|eukprot:KAF5832492.1 hypothetical protein DUNSADRAFT_11592 [Dunaliella salina]
MGVGNSKLEKALAESSDEERFYGLENFGNTCYVNSVFQALYFCKPFRERMLQYAEQRRGNTDDLPGCLAELFLQDAHEFLNYLLNQAAEVLEEEVKQQRQVQGGGAIMKMQPQPQEPIVTWVHDIFQGKLVNETRCLQCETVTSREEVFMDLSLEIDQNCSLTSCLRNFSLLGLTKGSKGHYVSLIKSHASWLFFDDENVETITESQVQSTFGSTQEYGNSNTDHGYILFYERAPASGTPNSSYKEGTNGAPNAGSTPFQQPH